MRVLSAYGIAVASIGSARRFRQQPWGREMVLVALTGWSQGRGSPAIEGGRLQPSPGQPADPAVVTKLLSEIPLAS